MSLTAAGAAPAANRGGKDIAFAVGIVLILCLFFLPVPAFMIDFGLALSIALAVLILMVALWIHKPLEFSAFPTVLLVATILRLALNISTTRLILSRGEQGPTSAGYIIGGFAQLVMGGDFVIGIIVFLILVTINFLVITKGATRIAEVGARFTLDAIPGKQMAIDADLSAGLIDEKVAQARRRELEEESAFFGSMDGASKFVRGDAIAGLIILAVNIFGGIVIGVTRHSLSLAAAADIFTKLSVGDGLVTQIPALIISLAAGLLVAKGGTRGSADSGVPDAGVGRARLWPSGRTGRAPHSRLAAQARSTRPRPGRRALERAGAGDAREACPAGARSRGPRPSAPQGAQGAGRAHRAGDRPPRRKLDIRLKADAGSSLGSQ
jgi:flagellar biosynthesis protein FlhA